MKYFACMHRCVFYIFIYLISYSYIAKSSIFKCVKYILEQLYMILQVTHMIYILLSISVRFFLFNSPDFGRCGQKLILDPGIQ